MNMRVSEDTLTKAVKLFRFSMRAREEEFDDLTDEQLSRLLYIAYELIRNDSQNYSSIEESIDAKTVRIAAEKFYSALNAMFTGDLEAMKEIWSHQDDVTYMGPAGGFLIGWKQILAEWETHAALKLGGKVEAKDMSITLGQDLAIVSNYEMGENLAADGTPFKVAIRATNLFRKENGEWKMIGHHTDLLPYLQK